MKPLILSLALLFSIKINAQTNTQASVVIVVCKSGTLILDGTIIGTVDANDATKQTISFGEHYLQLKTVAEKFNQTLNIDQNTKGIIKIGCDPEVKAEGIRLINKEVALSGALTYNPDQNVFGFDADDVVNLNCTILNKKGKKRIKRFMLLYIKKYT